MDLSWRLQMEPPWQSDPSSLLAAEGPFLAATDRPFLAVESFGSLRILASVRARVRVRK